MLHGGNDKIKKIQAFKTGSCSALERMSRSDGRLKKITFPSLVFLIQHESGYILFDTGYGDHFFHASDSFPYRLYRLATPVTYEKENSIWRQLQKLGIHQDEITTIFLSHFHGDHTGGLLDFPSARIICSERAWEDVKDLKGIKAVKKAYLPKTIPTDFEGRAKFIEQMPQVYLNEKYAPFEKGYDILGDGSMIAVFIEGHARGQIGLIIDDIFLCADAVWSKEALRRQKAPSKLTKLIIPSWTEYMDTFHRLIELQKNHPQLEMIPSHCEEVPYE